MTSFLFLYCFLTGVYTHAVATVPSRRRDTLRLLGAIEIHRNRAVYVSLNTNANPTPNPNTNPNPNPNPNPDPNPNPNRKGA